MDFDDIIGNITRHISVDPTETEFFTSLLTQRAIGKKEHILTEGSSCPSIYYIKDGALRAYYRDANDNESIIMFAINDWWLTDMYAFANEKPAMLNIEALEESLIVELRKTDLDRLYERVPKFERFFRIIMQNAYIREQLRIIQNLSMPAEERYSNFLTKYPQFAQRVPLKQIASYLGITPEHLSVLRKKATSRKLS